MIKILNNSDFQMAAAFLEIYVFFKNNACLSFPKNQGEKSCKAHNSAKNKELKFEIKAKK